MSSTGTPNEFDFNRVFILDLANNHQGSVEHGRRIIRELGAVARENGARCILKFQFRELDTFVHPAHVKKSDNKHVGRFLSTRLSNKEYGELTAEVRKAGMITASTPFDEASVDLIVELGIEVVKIASCSAMDWPLLERIADCGKPVVFSTGGLSWEQIDDLVSFFDHRHVQYAIMHCVAIYPTPTEQLQLNQIELLRRRYAKKPIGFSTHEAPRELMPVQIAVAKGATLLERHVGIETDDIKLNAYSSTPAQIDAWIKAAQQAWLATGPMERGAAPPEESASLQSLRRGVYARKKIKNGATLERADVYFAMPCADDQLSSGDWGQGITAAAELEKDAPLSLSSVVVPHDPEKQILFTAIHSIKAMLNEANIALNTEFETEFSHHHGIPEFSRVGATIVNCVNRGYCKKLIVQLPGQSHPLHYHKRKEETFQVLHGTLEIEIEGRRRTLQPGDIQLVQQGVWHRFWTDTGVIFEEISSTHYNNDSFYEDKAINSIDRSQRKTTVNNWGRYQI